MIFRNTKSRLRSTLALLAGLAVMACSSQAFALTSPFGNSNTLAVIATLFDPGAAVVVPGVIWIRLSDNACIASALPNSGGLLSQDTSVDLGGGADTTFFVTSASWSATNCGGYNLFYSGFNHNFHVVYVNGGAGADTMTGSSSAYGRLDGSFDNDRLVINATQDLSIQAFARGMPGDDILISSTYNTWLRGDQGNDTFCVRNGVAEVEGGSQSDRICGWASSYSDILENPPGACSVCP